MLESLWSSKKGKITDRSRMIEIGFSSISRILEEKQHGKIHNPTENKQTKQTIGQSLISVIILSVPKDLVEDGKSVMLSIHEVSSATALD